MPERKNAQPIVLAQPEGKESQVCNFVNVDSTALIDVDDVCNKKGTNRFECNVPSNQVMDLCTM